MFIEEAWKHHLRAMDDLKQEVQNASYEQKDPLLIYKIEASKMFDEMLLNTYKEIAGFLMRGNLPGGQQESNLKEARQSRNTDLDKLKAGRDDSFAGNPNNNRAQANDEAPAPKPEPVRVGPKIGRNDLCPCGSGKKYKKCHGIDEE